MRNLGNLLVVICFLLGQRGIIRTVKARSNVCESHDLKVFLCDSVSLREEEVGRTFEQFIHGQVHIAYLGARKQDDPALETNRHHDMLASILGSKQAAAKSILYSYRHGFSGFAAKLTESQVQELAECPGVVRVMPNALFRLQTTRSWDFLGLSPSPSPTSLLWKSRMGDGVIVGILDSGIWPESKAFNDEGLGPIPSRWKGGCEPAEQFDPAKHCNRKIIGARWFVDGFLAEYGRPLNASGDREFLSPRDANGHGTHTSSTAVGSFVSNVSYRGIGYGIARGGAPRARLAVYKVCWNVLGGQCSSADILKAFDVAIHDGVDVLSLSIGTAIPLFSDVDDRDGIATGAFHAVARGITVVCGAANDGPAAQSVQNTAPWILTVGASTMDRAFRSLITLGNNETLAGQAIYTGKEIGFTSLLYPEGTALDPTSAGVCELLSPNATLMAGKVVLCFSYLTSRLAATIAAAAVNESRGVGVIVAKNPSDGSAPCSGDFPCVEVDYEIGTRILLYFRSARFPVAKLSRTITAVGKAVPARVAVFSSRGPSSISPAILKPDVAAPGVNVLAATSPFDPSADNGYAMHSGTSMSTPHVAGIVTLLKALHPDWSPAALRSALVTTAWRSNPSCFPIFASGNPPKLANAFDMGGGITNPNSAAEPGLIYDAGMPDYIVYLCAMGYNDSAISHLTEKPTHCPTSRPSVTDVNLPSITIPSLRSSVTVTRTVTNTGPPGSRYWAEIEPPSGTAMTVKPRVLAFNRRTKKMAFGVTVRAIAPVNTGYYFGSLVWTDGVHAVRSPLAVRIVNQTPFYSAE